MLYLVRGMPGSGKSTFARNCFPGIFHIENDMLHMKTSTEPSLYPINNVYDFKDDLRIERAAHCKRLVDELLSFDIPVVVSNVFSPIKSLNSYIDLAKYHQVPFKVFRMINDLGNQHDVPNYVLKWMKENFEDYPGEYLVKLNPEDLSYWISAGDTNENFHAVMVNGKYMWSLN